METVFEIFFLINLIITISDEPFLTLEVNQLKNYWVIKMGSLLNRNYFKFNMAYYNYWIQGF